jgi:hypothetical protein
MLSDWIKSILQMRNLYINKTIENNFIKYEVYKNKVEKVAEATSIIDTIYNYDSCYDFVKINYKHLFNDFEEMYSLSIHWIGIERLYINEYKGIGTILMIYLLNDIRETHPKVQLSTLDNMASDLSFYEKMGYIWITGRRDDGPEMIGTINDIINKSICKIKKIENFWKSYK